MFWQLLDMTDSHDVVTEYVDALLRRKQIVFVLEAIISASAGFSCFCYQDGLYTKDNLPENATASMRDWEAGIAKPLIVSTLSPTLHRMLRPI